MMGSNRYRPPTMQTYMNQTFRESQKTRGITAKGKDEQTDIPLNDPSIESFTEGSLCERCIKVPLPCEASAKTNFRYPIRYLGRLKDIRQRTRCPFCRLVKSALLDGPVPFRGYEKISVSWGVRGYQIHEGTGNIDARIAFLHGEGPSGPRYNFARAVNPEQISIEQVRGWMNRCERSHGDKCSSPLQIPGQVDRLTAYPARVIDVNEQCVVPVDGPCKYVTLSYVWGQASQLLLTKDNKHDLMSPGFLKTMSEKVPTTILDAIDLVSKIGEKYLWVDALCLIQDDEADMRSGIQIMDSIYQGSVLTITAASGSDANAGLPGLRSNSRQSSQLIEAILPGMRMTVIHSLPEYMGCSKYATRGWTFQEQLLSARSLIFINNQVFFLCSESIWSEETVVDVEPFDFYRGQPETDPLFQRMSLNRAIPPYQMYQEFVSEYSERDLTKDSDAINALTGVLRRFSARVNSRLLCGLPTAVFDLSVLFQNESSALQRRAEFPSYSWAGWKGQVSWLILDVDWYNFNDTSNSGSDGASPAPKSVTSHDSIPGDVVPSSGLPSPDYPFETPELPSDSHESSPSDSGSDSQSGPDLFAVEKEAMEWIESSDSDSSPGYSALHKNRGVELVDSDSDSDCSSPDSDWESASSHSETLSISQSPEGWLLSKTWIIWYERSPTGVVRPVWNSEDEKNLGSEDTGYRCRSEFNAHGLGIIGDFSQTEPTIDPSTFKRLPGYSLLQFWTVSVLLSLSRHANQADWRADIINRDLKQCGQINLSQNIHFQPVENDDPGRVHEFLLLSESKYFCQPTGILPGGSLPPPCKPNWGFYWVMLIRWDETGIAERMGIGQISASAALGKSYGSGPKWKEIVLG